MEPGLYLVGLNKEGRRQRTEDRGQKTEDGGQRAEDRGRRTEGGRQRDEDREKTEDRRQKTEDRRLPVLFQNNWPCEPPKITSQTLATLSPGRVTTRFVPGG